MKAIISLLFLLVFALFPLAGENSALGQQNYGYWTGVKLQWTAPGDDLNEGTAKKYDIRLSTSWISTVNWESATPVISPPRPLEAGQTQICYISGLAQGNSYYFALKTGDEADNWSLLSNTCRAQAETYSYVCGDVTGDGKVNLADITHLIGFIYLEGPPPLPLESGNLQQDPSGKVNLADLTVLISYVYLDGPTPYCGP